MPQDKMRHYLQWPEKHGFSIGGLGPSYVLSVVKGSAADKQGLKVGDRIIELDNHRVGKMAAPALESFAKRLNNKMPTIKVTNEIQYVELIATRLYRNGLTLQYSQRNGFLIDTIHPKGPAYKAGLRQGDLVTEVNGDLIYEKANSLLKVKNVLSAHRGRTTLAVLPCKKRHSASNSHSPNRSHQTSKTTRDLYAKINNIFSQNYEKKLALIGVLKSYSETGNIEKLAKSLALVLQTPNQRKVIPYIRLHIPISDRKDFDDIIQRSIGKSYAQDRLTQPAQPLLQDYSNHRAAPNLANIQPSPANSQSSLLYLRSLIIHKGDGDLGVLMKGRNPVVIETVLPNSAAEAGGVLKGDCVLKINQESVVNSSHYYIQQLMKRAGPTICLEVIQQVHMAEGPQQTANGTSGPSHIPLPDARVSEVYDTSTLSSQISRSSSAEWAFHNSLRPQDRDPGSFKTQVNYLLDQRDKRMLKQYLFDYSSDKDIQVFVQRTSALLDTPAKMTLWSFVLPLIPSNHREYTLQQVQLPDSVVNSGQRVSTSTPRVVELDDSATLGADVPEPDSMAAFKSLLEYLLTSQERKAVKRALHHYKDDKNIETLVEELAIILDTQSKRSLWIHILALLPTSHQNYARRKINLPSGFMRETAGKGTPRYLPEHSRRNRILSQSEDEFFVVGQHQVEIDDRVSLGDTEEDESSVEVLKYMRKGSYVQRGQHMPGADNFMENPLYGKYDPMSLSQEADYPSNGVIEDPGIYAYDAITLPNDRSGSYRRGRSNTAYVARAHSAADTVSHTNGYHHSATPRTPRNNHRHQSNGDHVTSDGIIVNGGDSDTDSLNSSRNSYQLHTSQGSDNSYKRKVKQALQTMDEAVAGFSGGETQRSEQHEKAASLAASIAPPPPPPPPPPPQAPPLPDLSAPLMVKRLNWETHSPEQIDQTVWGQLKSDDQLDIGVMVEYLELPQQFSTIKKKPSPAKQEKKNTKRKILREKKAFNTSIILASVNIPGVRSSEQRDKHIEQALLRVEVHMDDEASGVITPHLLQQLLQYAPSKEEVEEYLSYDGELSALSEVDRFCYRMIRIPGYQDRLQSMLFKATFDEKCSEVEESLHLVKGASEQIRRSKSFAKILELVLAMGNQLHKATNAPPATAFKVSSLNQLDSTKTMDKKKSFLDVLVQAVYEKFPQLFSTSDELCQVPLAEKVTFHELSKEAAELQHVLQQISETMGHLSAEAKHYTVEDRFQEVMEHFVGSAEDRIQHLVRLQADTNEQFEGMLLYLGERSGSVDSKAIFSTISQFLTKFDNCRRLYLQRVESDILSPRVPTSETAQFISAL